MRNFEGVMYFFVYEVAFVVMVFVIKMFFIVIALVIEFAVLMIVFVVVSVIVVGEVYFNELIDVSIMSRA